MSANRLLYITGKDAERYSDRIATDAALIANDALEAENAATRIEIERLNLYRRPEVKPIVLASEATRARSRGGLERPPQPPSWVDHLPKPANAYAAPQVVKRLDEFSPADQAKIRNLM